ncbi:aminodeoxychorismate lyase [Modicisalibacter tunisiensis]|uniref:Aminodeoxychorismate lyase n=1 Tax=Modicisalibacter tunisiensis TaxID=390637 RepID=A0ABS7X198_9GAMM|nr:aminodeoxychorismate lyase [Modicisalibacter tunisiensis]MBZ9568683.1 aminodeoxychorismate lyase [Modicisalibacter tunisiensis]
MQDDGVPFDDRGLAYGDGVFETVLVRDGRPLLWDAHVARLRRGCERLGIPCPEHDLPAALPGRAGSGLAVLKLIVTRGSGGRGYLPPVEPQPRYRWRVTPFAPRETAWREGVTIRLCDLRLARQPALAGIKHLNRLENVMARREWDDPAIAEGVLLDTEGHVVETTSMNLFWHRAGRWETPALDACGVAGTLREGLRERLPIAVVTAGVDALMQADSLWVGNSVQGLWPVRRLLDARGVERQAWPVPSTSARILQDAAHELLGYPRLTD